VWVPNYVAKLRAGVLSAKRLKPLGHIFDFATFRIRLLPKVVTYETAPPGKDGAFDSAVRSGGQAC
jgi:hypothetical protein